MLKMGYLPGYPVFEKISKLKSINQYETTSALQS